MTFLQLVRNSILVALISVCHVYINLSSEVDSYTYEIKHSIRLLSTELNTIRAVISKPHFSRVFSGFPL